MNTTYRVALAIIASALLAPLAGAEETAPPLRVVYPASATSRIPTTIAPPREVKPPVREDVPIDVDTPVGQVSAIRESLDDIRASQERIEEALEKLAEAPSDSRDDEILEALAEMREALVGEPTFPERAEEPIPSEVSPSNRDRSEAMPSRFGTLWTIALFVVAWLVSIALWRAARSAFQTAREIANLAKLQSQANKEE
ncbi:MAG: hypothetical protein IJM30_04225 [Thermoguttaceae bacterium]|nr:hypothetical protein [Thermoguttaceae bacterium]